MTDERNTNVAQDEADWEEIGGQLWQWESPNQILEGILKAKGTVEVTNPQGGQNVIGQYFIDADGDPIILNGGANIDGKLAVVEIGSRVRITFLGTVKTNANRTVNTFKVQVRK